MSKVILQVEDLRSFFFTRKGVVKAVDGVSFYVREGETFGLVGESACGKTVTALSILRLLPEPAGQNRWRQDYSGRDESPGAEQGGDEEVSR